MLSNVAQFPEIVAVYPRQSELETIIERLVRRNQGIKETDLWLMVLAEMTGLDRPAVAIVAGTIRRMLDRGDLVGVDYTISGHGNTFLLPPHTTISVTVPIRIERTETASITVLHPKQ